MSRYSNGLRKVGVVGNDGSDLKLLKKCIPQEVTGKIDIRTFLFSFIYPNLFDGHDVRQIHWNRMRAELPILDFKVRDCPQRADIQTLIVRGAWIRRPGTNSCRKVFDRLDSVGREKGLAKRKQIQPLVGGSLQGPIVKIKTVNVYVNPCQRLLLV